MVDVDKSISDVDFKKGDGLVPVIVQDANTKEVLTLAYSNKESLELAKNTGNSWFWSRSRSKLWMKGEESGNIQKINKKNSFRCDFKKRVEIEKECSNNAIKSLRPYNQSGELLFKCLRMIIIQTCNKK